MSADSRFGRVAFAVLMGMAAYWLSNAIIWIPWILNKWAGMAFMLLFVPCAWGCASLLCLRRAPDGPRLSECTMVAGVMLASSAVSDVFFFLLWRHMPLEELYHPTTLAAYALVLIMPFLMRPIAARQPRVLPRRLVGPASAVTVASFLFTLWSVRFW